MLEETVSFSFVYIDFQKVWHDSVPTTIERVQANNHGDICFTNVFTYILIDCYEQQQQLMSKLLMIWSMWILINLF